MEIREINSLDEFKSLRGTWNSLLAESHDKNIFLTWEWLFMWWKYFHSSRKLCILLIEDGNNIKGIVPLARSTYRTLFLRYTIIENMGIPLSDYGGMILSDNEQTNEVFTLLGTYIKENKSIFRFDQVPNESKLYTSLDNQSFYQDLFIRGEIICYSPYLDLSSSWEEYRNTLSKKLRKNLRRGQKLIEKDFGDIEFKRYSISKSVEMKLNNFLVLHHKKMSYKKLPSFSEDQKAFFAETAKNFADNGWLNLSFLEANGQPVSSVLGFEYDKKYYYYQTAFDPAYSSYGVGMIHIAYLIKDLIDRRFREFDFLRGDEAYKLRWKPILRSNNRIVLMRKTPASKTKFKMLNGLLRYDEIRKRSLFENYRLYINTRKQDIEKRKIKR